MRLFFVRHADALPNAGSDFDRELSSKGLKQLREISNSFLPYNLASFEIYVSPARRTLQTWIAIAETLRLSNDVHTIDALYNADEEVYQDIISNSTHQNLLFVGHNPGISLIASDVSRTETQLSTGSWVLLNLDFETSTCFVEDRFTPQESF